MPPDRDHALERELKDLGTEIEYPPTPDLARAVRARLEDEGTIEPSARPQMPGRTFPTPRWVAAAALVLLVAVPTLSGLRAVLDGGGLGAGGGAEGGAQGGGDQASGGGREAPSGQEEAGRDASSDSSAESDGEAAGGGDEAAEGAGSGVPSTEEAEASAAASAGGAPDLPAGLELGDRLTRWEARDRVGGFLLLPRAPDLGGPDGIYASEPPPESGVTLVYDSRPGVPPVGEDTGLGLLLTEARGDVESAYLSGETAAGAGFESLEVGGERGYWSPGSLPPEPDSTGREPSGVLLWERGGVALRIEASLPKEEAVRIAESVR